MAEYQLLIRSSASKEFEALPKAIIERMRAKIKALAIDPRPEGSKKLRGSQKGWRIRVGDYRVLYQIDDAQKIVHIGAVRHRSEAYR